MLRRLLTWVRGSSDRHGSADGRDSGDGTGTAGKGAGAGAEGEGDESEGGFLRSRLDASVLYAHGQQNARAARTLEETREEADRLEEAREAPER